MLPGLSGAYTCQILRSQDVVQVISLTAHTHKPSGDEGYCWLLRLEANQIGY